MKKKAYNETRSAMDIIDFIDSLPGGNPQQYAKLLGIGAQRITGILGMKNAQDRLVKRGRVRIGERGQRPMWAQEDTQRGSLRAKDIDTMASTGSLPKFVTDAVATVHSDYQGDMLNFLKEAVEQTAGKVSIERVFTNHVGQARHYTDDIVQISGRLEERSNRLLRLEALLDRSLDLGEKLTQQRLPFVSAQEKEQEV